MSQINVVEGTLATEAGAENADRNNALGAKQVRAAVEKTWENLHMTKNFRPFFGEGENSPEALVKNTIDAVGTLFSEHYGKTQVPKDKVYLDVPDFFRNLGLEKSIEEEAVAIYNEIINNN